MKWPSHYRRHLHTVGVERLVADTALFLSGGPTPEDLHAKEHFRAFACGALLPVGAILHARKFPPGSVVTVYNPKDDPAYA